MRKKFGEMHNEMQQYKHNIEGLNSQVTKLKDENLKLTTDIKVIRSEHTGMLHTVRKLEEKNQHLVTENLTLKDILYERKARGFQNQIELGKEQSQNESQELKRENESLNQINSKMDGTKDEFVFSSQLNKNMDSLNQRGRPPASQQSLPI